MIAALLAAQLATAAPGVDCSLLTPAQARGLVCAAPPRPLDGPRTDAAPSCDPRPNPYEQPALASACAAWGREHEAKPVLPVFAVGATYADPYGSLRMTVLSVSVSVAGVPVVTAEYTHGAGAVGKVFAFRADDARAWELVP